MAKVSVKSAARTAKSEDAKLRAQAAKTGDSFQNFAANLGIGTDNVSSGGTYGFNPITRIRTKLEWIYRGSWLGGIAVDTIADDMTRAGIDLRGEIEPGEIERFEQAMVQYGIWAAISDTIKWAKLYGGAIAVMLIDGQQMHTPLNLDTIGKGQFKGLFALDRWQVDSSLNDLVTDFGPAMGLPKFYTVLDNASGLQGKKIHYSRCLRLEGVHLPYQQRLMENLWGLSVYERLYDRMLGFDSATSGACQLAYKSYLRVYKINKFREAVAAGGPQEAGLIKFVSFMRRFQSSEGITMIDGEDDLGALPPPSFTGLVDVLVHMGQQFSGGVGIPLVRLFGQSPVGLNSTGESDLRLYYQKIKQDQVRDLTVPVTAIAFALAKSEGITIPEGTTIDFRSLWVLSDVEKSTIASQDSATIVAEFNAGMISEEAALLEKRQLSKLTGRGTNVTDDMIDAANKVSGAQMQSEMQEEQLDMQREEHEAGLEEGDESKNKKSKDSRAADCDEGAKLTHEEVKYNVGKGEERCENCRSYQNGACQLVQSPIAPRMWCEEFRVRLRVAA